MTQHEGRKTAVGYARVSTGDQAGRTSLCFQQERIMEWCDRKGFELVAMLWDEGTLASTDDIGRRPGLATLLELLPQLRPDIVVVHSLDRWARSSDTAVDSFRVLGSLNIGFASVTEQQYAFSPRFILGIMASFAAFAKCYRSYRSKRVRRKDHP